MSIRDAQLARLTDEDVMIALGRFSEVEGYEHMIADRNDAAIMLARTTLSLAGCRAICKRMMPA